MPRTQGNRGPVDSTHAMPWHIRCSLGIEVDFTKETDHEMETRVCDGAHGSVRGRKRACSDRSRNDAHAGLAGHQTSRHSTRQPARDPAGLATTAADASAGNPQPAAE